MSYLKGALRLMDTFTLALYVGLAVWDWALFVAHPSYEAGLMKYMVSAPLLALAYTTLLPLAIFGALAYVGNRLNRWPYWPWVLALILMRAAVIIHNYSVLGAA